MAKKSVCMTGATGHVGYALLKELQNYDDRDVRILLRKDPGIFEGFRCEKVKGDITDYESLVRAFQGVDIVYHIAGCVEIKPGNEEHVYNINVNGTKNVVRACKVCGVKKLVYMSSVDTYVPLPDNQEMTEVYHYDPDELEGTYAKTKAEATQFVLDANKPGELETVVCQPSACMGPYDFKVSSVGSMIRMFSTGKFPITMTFGGYNFVDVRDVAKGTIAAGDVGGAGEVYILCNKSVTVDEFIRLLAKAGGNKPPKIKLGKGIIDIAAPMMEIYYKAADQTPLFTRYAIRKLCSNCNFSYAKAQRELGYDPRPLEESLSDTLKWIKEEEQRQKEETAKRAEEALKRSEEAARRAADAERRAEEAEKRAEEERRKAEEEREQAEIEWQKSEEEREKAEAETKLKAKNDKKQAKAEEKKKEEAEARKAEEEKQKLKEEKQKLKEERQKLKDDKQKLNLEKQKLKEEKQKLKEEKQKLKEEKQKAEELEWSMAQAEAERKLGKK